MTTSSIAKSDIETDRLPAPIIQRRAVGLRRAIRVVQVLATARTYLTTSDVLERLLSDFGTDYHYKAVFDDLRTLEEAGLVHAKSERSQGRAITWHLYRDRAETLPELCEGPFYDVFEAGLDDEWGSIEEDGAQLNAEPANAAQVARMLEGRTRPIKQVIVEPNATGERSSWDVWAVNHAGERDQLNTTPCNAAQIERLLELLRRPVKRLIVQTDAPSIGGGWMVSAVDIDGDCDGINADPFDAMQVGLLLESLEEPVKRLILQPFE